MKSNQIFNCIPSKITNMNMNSNISDSVAYLNLPIVEKEDCKKTRVGFLRF